MATSNSRNVRLGVEIATTGQESLSQAAGEMKRLATESEGAAPSVQDLATGLDRLAAEAEALRAAEAAARAEQTAAKRTLDERRQALELLRAETDRATKGTAEYEAKERALKVAVVEARAAVRDKQAALSAAAEATRAAVTAENEHAAALARAIAAQRASTAATKDQGSALELLRGQLALLRNIAGAALGGTLIGSLARDLAETADSVANLRARLSLVAGDGAALEQAYRGVLDVAQRTGASLETVGTLFTRIAQAGKDFNLSQRDALALTETIGQAVAVSGGAAQSADAAITQLIQGLQSGVLRGEEFNSVLEQAPRLARALADGLGVTTGELRNLANAGTLTTETVIKALRGQAVAIQTEFDKLPPTVGRAITNLGTAWSDYVSQVDQATGASTTAARAIQALAGNLDTLGSLLAAAGKTAAAYTALRIAESFIASAAAAQAAAGATAAATAATTANTTATAANTAAQAANAAAVGATAGASGRLASLLSTVRTVALVGVVANLRDIGTYIGETVAKLRGADDRVKELERTIKADADAKRANAAATEALAQAAALATDRALGLNKQSKELIGTFDGLIAKGESTADAVGKVAKSLDLSDIRGIGIAITALDALALRGKITADQLREALGTALKGEDLQRFETQARAAFDKSEQGARRLKAALDAIADESLKRAGTSAQELGSGFSAAAASAINDLDALQRTLRELKAPADEASRALSASVDKALTAANTERAVRAVVDRLAEMGKAGTLAGDALAQGLQKAQSKLDELRPGINSVAEALRTFGLKTRDELTATADKLEQAYLRIAGRADVSLQDQARAFGQWRDAAVAAGRNVETGQLALQERMLAGRIAATGLGDSIEGAMQRGAAATDRASSALDRYRSLLASTRALGGPDGSAGTLGDGSDIAARNATVRSGAAPGSFGALINSTPSGGTTRTVDTGQAVNRPNDGGEWTYVLYGYDVPGQDARGNPLPGGWKHVSGGGYVIGGGGRATPSAAPAAAPVAAPAAATADGTAATLAQMTTLLGQLVAKSAPQPVVLQPVQGEAVTVYAAPTEAQRLAALLAESWRRAGV